MCPREGALLLARVGVLKASYRFLPDVVLQELFDDKLGLPGGKPESDALLGLDDFDLLNYNDPNLAQTAAQLPTVPQLTPSNQRQQQRSANKHLKSLLSADINTLQPEVHQQERYTLEDPVKLEPASPPATAAAAPTSPTGVKPQVQPAPEPQTAPAITTALLNALQQTPANSVQTALVQQLLQQQVQQQQQQQQQSLQEQLVRLLTQQQQQQPQAQTSSPQAVPQTVVTAASPVQQQQNSKPQKIILAQPAVSQATAGTGAAATTTPPAQIIINAPAQQPTTVGSVNLQQLQQVSLRDGNTVHYSDETK